MLKKSLKMLSVLSFVLLASCAGNPPDEPLCTELTVSRGYCVRMISGEGFEVDDERLYDGKTWWELRPTMIQMPAKTWAELKKWIIKICKNNNQCDDAVANWERTVDRIDNVVKP